MSTTRFPMPLAALAALSLVASAVLLPGGLALATEGEAPLPPAAEPIAVEPPAAEPIAEETVIDDAVAEEAVPEEAAVEETANGLSPGGSSESTRESRSTAPFALAATGSISGRLVDTAGNPIAGVKAFVTNDDFFVISDPSDAFGDYSVPDLPEGTYVVRFFATGYIPEAWPDSSDPFLEPNVVVVGGQDTAGIGGELVREAVVSATVQNAAGDPIAGAGTLLCSDSMCYFGAADANGVSSYDRLFPGVYRFTASASGPYLETTVESIVLAEGDIRDLGVVTLSTGAVISGTVTGPDGPLADVAVVVRNAAPGNGQVATAYTDAQGEYSTTAVPPGSYTLYFSPPTDSGAEAEWWDDKPTFAASTAFSVVDDSPLTGFDAVLAATPETSTITGTVTGSDTFGAGLEGIWVSLEGDGLYYSGMTDQSGSYTLSGVVDGDYSMLFSPPFGNRYLAEWWGGAKFQSTSVPVVVRAGVAIPPMVVALTPGATISGVVTGADDPTVGLGDVHVIAWSRTDSDDFGYAITEPDGSYTMTGLYPGTYDIRVDAPPGSVYESEWYNNGYSQSDGTPVTVGPGQDLANIDVELARWFWDLGNPVMSGTFTVGQTITAVPRNWSPAPDYYLYQWYRGSTAIAGATSSTYVLTEADGGARMRVATTAVLAGYNSETTTSNQSAAVQRLLDSAVPTIGGTAEFGQTLTAVPGAWGPAPVTVAYQWRRDGAAISGARSSTYALVAADIGKAITVTVTGTKTGHATTSQTSLATARIALGTILNAVLPSVTGTPVVGSVLTANQGSWAPAPVALATAWTRDGVAIAGQAGATYTLTQADAGAVIAIEVTGTKTNYATMTVTSLATGLVTGGTLTAVVPTIAGTPEVGEVLTAVPGSWGPAPVALSYQWFRDGVAIAGADGVAHTLVNADAGALISVEVSAAKAGFDGVSETSLATGLVTGGTLTAVVPTISGTAAVGQTLTADAGTWGPGVVALSFEWTRSGTVVAGATGTTYIVRAEDIGQTIVVTVSGARPGFDSDARSSLATSAVPALPVAPPAPPTVAETPPPAPAREIVEESSRDEIAEVAENEEVDAVEGEAVETVPAEEPAEGDAAEQPEADGGETTETAADGWIAPVVIVLTILVLGGAAGAGVVFLRRRVLL